MPGYRPTTPRGPAPKPAEVGVRFVKTAVDTWEGNGFGNSGAEWVALMGNVEVGRYEGRRSDAFGVSTWGATVTRWRETVCREAAKGL